MIHAELLQQQTIQNLRIHNLPIPERDALTEITERLERSQKQVSPKFVYDSEGSCIFDAITQLPEYYPTRTEQHIFFSTVTPSAKLCAVTKSWLS